MGEIEWTRLNYGELLNACASTTHPTYSACYAHRPMPTWLAAVLRVIAMSYKGGKVKHIILEKKTGSCSYSEDR